MLLDELDLKILEELEEDARQSIHTLAKKIGMKRTTVNYRLNRLKSAGILKIACVGNPELLGYQFLIVIGINAYPGRVDDVTNELAPLPAMTVVTLTAGRYNIMAWALLRDRLSLANLISEQLTNILGILSFDLMHSYQWVRDSWRYFKPQVDTIREPLKHFPSDIDLSIVNAMEMDPRQTMATLAKTVGCSRSDAKTRLDKLLSDGVIRFASIVNPRALGYEISVIILIKSQADSLYGVANELSMQSNSRHVSLITGQWQIFVAAQFKDSEQMHNFISDTMLPIPGVLAFEVIHIVKILKFSLNILGSAYPFK